MTPKTPSSLIDLPTELLQDIFSSLPSLATISSTNTFLRAVSHSQQTKRLWMKKWFQKSYSSNWEYLLNDCLLWDKLSVCFRGTSEYGTTNRFDVQDSLPRITRGRLMPTDVTKVLTQDGMLAALLKSAPPPLNLTWHPGQRSSERCIEGEFYWTSLFLFACFYNLPDSAEICLPVVEKVLSFTPSDLREVLDDALECAALGGSHTIIKLLRDRGYCMRMDRNANRVEDWCTDLAQVMADECLTLNSQESVETASKKRRRSDVLGSFIDAFAKDRDTQGLAVWDYLLQAGIGDAFIMNTCLGRSGHIVLQENDLLTSSVKHMLALNPQASTPNHTAAILTAAILSSNSELLESHLPKLQAFAPEIRTGTLVQLLPTALMSCDSPILNQLLSSFTPPYTPYLKQVLDLTILTARPELLEHMVRNGLNLTDAAAANIVSRALVVAILKKSSFSHNHIARVREGLELLASHNAQIARDGELAFQYAAEFGDIWAVEWFMSKGLDISGHVGVRALSKASYAWRSGRTSGEVFEWLMRNGAGRNA